MKSDCGAGSWRGGFTIAFLEPAKARTSWNRGSKARRSMNAASICLVIAAGLLAACEAVGTTSTPTPAPSATPAPPPTQTQIPFETVAFATEDGVRLAGTLRGEGEIAVILAHQGTPHADQNSWATFAHLLAEHGIASLAFDFRGIGDRKST